MDCLAIETLRAQILYALLLELITTYKKEPTNTQKIESLKDHITIFSGKDLG
ncbi:MAG: hypothetical protein JO297_09515 [Nitrososphaeraceae archaeon]|nr:hypothetical protein [Nitrososphaeraceae archaeon]